LRHPRPWLQPLPLPLRRCSHPAVCCYHRPRPGFLLRPERRRKQPLRCKSRGQRVWGSGTYVCAGNNSNCKRRHDVECENATQLRSSWARAKDIASDVSILLSIRPTSYRCANIFITYRRTNTFITLINLVSTLLGAPRRRLEQVAYPRLPATQGKSRTTHQAPRPAQESPLRRPPRPAAPLNPTKKRRRPRGSRRPLCTRGTPASCRSEEQVHAAGRASLAKEFTPLHLLEV
jgi:hypothetical protein